MSSIKADRDDVKVRVYQDPGVSSHIGIVFVSAVLMMSIMYTITDYDIIPFSALACAGGIHVLYAYGVGLGGYRVMTFDLIKSEQTVIKEVIREVPVQATQNPSDSNRQSITINIDGKTVNMQDSVYTE